MAPKLAKPKVKDIKKWVAALRSGEYDQTKEALQDAYGYCCLGVACEVFIPDPHTNFEGHIVGALPNAQLRAPGWLVNTGNLARFKGGNTETGNFLSNLNDQHDFTFDEIADILELAYIHKAIEVAYD